MDIEGADSSVSCFGSLMMIWREHGKKYLVFENVNYFDRLSGLEGLLIACFERVNKYVVFMKWGFFC